MTHTETEPIDSMLEEITRRRTALETSQELIKRTLYPKLWSELRWTRQRVHDLEQEVTRLRAEKQDTTPTVKLPRIDATLEQARLVEPAASHRGRGVRRRIGLRRSQ